MRSPHAHRASAALLGRSGHALAIREVHEVRARRMRPGARATSNSSAASTAWIPSRTCSDRLRRRATSCWAWAMSTSARPSPRPRSAASPGHHQVQSRPHLDGGNSVGIGGAYLCIYGMEGPGGYQFVGRTLQVWNTYRQTRDFRDGKPWLLRFFDQIRVSSRSAARNCWSSAPRSCAAQASLRTEPHLFALKEYNRFLHDNHADIAAFRDKQQTAFRAERANAGRPRARAKLAPSRKAKVPPRLPRPKEPGRGAPKRARPWTPRHLRECLEGVGGARPGGGGRNAPVRSWKA